MYFSIPAHSKFFKLSLCKKSELLLKNIKRIVQIVHGEGINHHAGPSVTEIEGNT